MNKKKNLSHHDLIHSLPTLSRQLADQGIKAQKAMGQHFLFDLNLTRKIARLANPESCDLIVEIGSGPGGLTRALLLENCPHIFCIEKDKRFYPSIQELVDLCPERISLIPQDALISQEASLLKDWWQKKSTPIANNSPKGPTVKIVANLPYNISIPLLVKWLKVRPLWWKEAILMFQKEVVQRLVAVPGHKSYGRLSVFVQNLSHVEEAFSIPARAFTPPPKIDSSIAIFTPKNKVPPDWQCRALEKIIFYAFNQRRKMLKKALKPAFSGLSVSAEDFLINSGLNPAQRAETVTPEEYLHLSKLWYSEVTKKEVSPMDRPI